MVIKSEREFKQALNKYKRENPNWIHEIEVEYQPIEEAPEKEEKKSSFISDVFSIMETVLDIMWR